MKRVIAFLLISVGCWAQATLGGTATISGTATMGAYAPVSGITRVQHIKKATSSSGPNIVIGASDGLSALTTGNLVVVTIGNSSGADHVTGVTDDKSGGSNTYTNVGTWSYANNFDSTTAVNLQVFYSCITGAAGNITSTTAGNGLQSVVVREYSGINCSGSPLDASAFAADTGTTTTDLSSGNVTPTVSGDLLVGGCVVKSPPNPNTLTAGSGWTDLLGYNPDGAGVIFVQTEDRFPYNSTSAVPMTMTASSATNFNCRVGAFKAQ